MSGSQINPTLFDKLVAHLDMDGLRDEAGDSGAVDADRSSMRFYIMSQQKRRNETALRETVKRELAWILNTTNLGAAIDLTPYPEVKTSVLNYGVTDLAGKPMTGRMITQRAREIRDSIRAFEPRMDPEHLDVTPLTTVERENAVTYVIRGDVTAAVQAMPVEFKTDVELDTAAVTVRE
jgi:type VI secretion system protein ImpF